MFYQVVILIGLLSNDRKCLLVWDEYNAISSERRSNRLRSTMAVMKLLISLLTLGLMISCTTNVQVEGSVPTPLVAKIPANVAVYYDENFKTFVHTEELDTEGTWNINLGEKNLEFEVVLGLVQLPQLAADAGNVGARLPEHEQGIAHGGNFPVRKG